MILMINNPEAVRCIIAGGRDFHDYPKLAMAFESFMNEYANDDVTIISGMAGGADTVGVKIAEYYGLELIKMPADWALHGKSAGFKRNAEMVNLATHLLAAWDGKSKDTKHTISLAEKKGLITKIVRYD
jgi:hypothetical protein